MAEQDSGHEVETECTVKLIQQMSVNKTTFTLSYLVILFINK